jgi:DNA-binding response OmpR family regulator
MQKILIIEDEEGLVLSLEDRLLKFFAENPQRVLNRYELLDEVWS